MSLEKIRQAGNEGKLLSSSVENLEKWLAAGLLPQWARDAVQELVDTQNWEELNNRFYKTITFGTGGMRDRTIGHTLTNAEKGTLSEEGTPAHAAVGSAMMNDFNVIRATIGLYKYSLRYLEQYKGYRVQPSLVIAHDMRHFSRHFAELACSTFTRLGGSAMLFDGPRPSPQLSFSVRYLQATCGVVVTASHNPAEYNGYKVYFSNGGQVIFPHAEGIIHEVYSVDLATVKDFLEKDLSKVVILPASVDEAYLEALEENLLDKEVIHKNPPKIVFTPIHGVGAVASIPALQKAGVDVHTVEEQMKMDPRFPTVESPNPEEGPALKMGMDKADEIGAECVIGTDPDCDRMGVAVRDREGKLVLLNGNTIGSLMAEYRVRKLKDIGIVPREGSRRAALIKTFVTTPLQAAIAKNHGLKLIDTLTGFKWIGEKLTDWEEELKSALREKEGIAIDYDNTSFEKRAELLLKYSTFYCFGGEESYGYLPGDRVRDKDANAAVLQFCEMLAALKAQGKPVLQFLDELYVRYGYYQEDLLNLVYEGASGAQKIKNILKSYRQDPPKKIGQFPVSEFKDFGVQDFKDADGKDIPKQDFYFFELENGYSFAVRGSGTEPKIKFYVFGQEDIAEPADLDDARTTAARTIEQLKQAIEADARHRAEQDLA